jgi:hypothetical protein
MKKFPNIKHHQLQPAHMQLLYEPEIDFLTLKLMRIVVP